MPKLFFMHSHDHKRNNTDPPLSRLLLPHSAKPSAALTEQQAAHLGLCWIGIQVRFQLVDENVQIEGYQQYAVEKWITDRKSPVTVLVVHTGNSDHKISLAALVPWHGLSPSDAQLEWNRALHHLREAGARPRDTPSGLLLVTSLANFRSDYTIIHLPFTPPNELLAMRSQLYANINLVRMSCAGRGAIGLAAPTDVSRERFATLFALPSSITDTKLNKETNINANNGSPVEPASPTISSRTKYSGHHYSTSKSDGNILGEAAGIVKRVSRGTASIDTHTSTSIEESSRISLFNATVLELVKLLQSSLEIFGMYGVDSKTGIRRDKHHASRKKLPAPSASAPLLDGLLCDITVEGLRRWVAEIGESYVGIEPTELTLDPTTFAALISLVLCTRNKLTVLGYIEADEMEMKDPFVYPRAFQKAVASFVDAESHKVRSHLPTQANNTPDESISAGINNLAPSATHMVLTTSILDSINAAYERATETSGRNLNINLNLNTKVQRVFLNKPTATTSDGDYDLDSGEDYYHHHHHNILAGSSSTQNQILSGLASGLTGKGVKSVSKSAGSVVSTESLNTGTMGIKKRAGNFKGGPTCVLNPVVDLGALVGAIGSRTTRTKGRTKDKNADIASLRCVAGSVKGVWTARALSVWKIREMAELEDQAIQSKPKEKEFDLEKLARKIGAKDRGVISEEEGAHNNATTEDEESDAFGNGHLSRLSTPWSGRMQKKIESWAGLSRRKGFGEMSDMNGKPGRFPANPPIMRDSPPSITFTSALDREDDEDVLSSGQASPVSDRKHLDPLTMLASAESSALNLNTFNQLPIVQKRPQWKQRMYQTRISSWSDPVSARGEGLADDADGAPSADKELSPRRKIEPSSLSRSPLVADQLTEYDQSATESLIPVPVVATPVRRVLTHGPNRRRSFHDLASYRETTRVLPFERMKIDMELCGQLLIMARRDEHLGDLLTCLQALTNTLSATNTTLRADYDSNAAALAQLHDRSKVIAEVEAELVKADMTAQERETLLYEAQQFQVADLWHMANAPRQKVFELREKVFGTGGRRLPQGVHGAHGPFNRLQRTLDGKERLVDQFGRTESEVEEEQEIDPEFAFQADEEEETEIISHPKLRPTWLLRFWNTWGVRTTTTRTTNVDTK